MRTVRGKRSIKISIMKKLNGTAIEKFVFYCLLVVTVVWFMFFINKGIDVTDMAYYLTKYKYCFESDKRLIGMGTFLTDILGSCIYHLCDTGQVLRLSFSHWLLYIGSGVLAYTCFKKYIPRIIILLAILGGSLFSLTWVHVMNYNATSMFFQTVAICILIKGIEKDKKKYYVISGFVFGLNTFFRFPNILQVCIGVSIFWYFAFCREEPINGLKGFGLYITGILGGWGIGGMLTLFILGKNSIFSYIFRTTKTAGNPQSGHGIKNILLGLYEGGRQGIKDWIYYGVVLLVLLLIWNAVVKIFKLTLQKEKTAYNMIFGMLVLFGFYIGRTLEYTRFYQMIGMCMLCVMLMGVFYYKRRNAFISTVCVIGFCAEAVLCVGTDNAWNYQVVFLIFPLCICMLEIYNCPSRYLKKNLILCAIFTGTLLFSVGYRYATQYVYRDSPNKELRYSIDAEEYKGVLTSKERARYLNELMVVLDSLGEGNLLCYGDFNIAYVITNMQPFLTSIWIDLESYSPETFKSDLEVAIAEKGYPIILIADVDQDGIFRSEEKLELIRDVLREGNYEKFYENEWYCVYQAE